ncbi:hypothetical protein JOQ06_011105 [Pogonophryne albipinna]|uniref:Interferon-induced protein 44-like n=1 Tax=Pogonophryne albipinna TaxID=1090488 RepID=A0AAD6AXP6_9TELE|nr:hypothetical protein JOQ06_011105 [Pogonophryne albipinna]
MLCGPVGAGKSSFINSVESALRGEITGRAKTDAIGFKSYTTKYKEYKIQKGGPGTHYPFVFNDVMGLDKDEGVCVEDIKLAMKGHVKDGYTFNPLSSLSEDKQNYNRDPSLNDRVHVLVCVIPGNTGGLQDLSVRKLREVRLAAREMGIPEIAILTKIDETCPAVDKDIRNVYKSKYLKKKIEEVSGELAFPPSCIFPVKNYHSEHETSDDTDTLILSALTRMIESGEDFVNNEDKCSILSHEWRNVPWGNKVRELQIVKEYQPFKDKVQLRFMLYGPVGAGKSSFINSVESVLRGKITDRAKTDAISGKSFTTSYKAYKIQKGGPGTHYPFVFNDVMGLEKDEGVCVEDIKLAMKGHVKNGYTFNPLSSLSENNQHYNRDPSLNDTVHVLVCVIPGNIARLQDDSVRKLREVRLAARDMGIPEIAILTKIDEACPAVGRDIRNVYKSNYLKNKIEEVSGVLGVPQNRIFPVKNYHSEIDTNDDTDTLILSALRRMIESGEDFVNDL